MLGHAPCEHDVQAVLLAATAPANATHSSYAVGPDVVPPAPLPPAPWLHGTGGNLHCTAHRSATHVSTAVAVVPGVQCSAAHTSDSAGCAWCWVPTHWIVDAHAASPEHVFTTMLQSSLYESTPAMVSMQVAHAAFAPNDAASRAPTVPPAVEPPAPPFPCSAGRSAMQPTRARATSQPAMRRGLTASPRATDRRLARAPSARRGAPPSWTSCFPPSRA